MLYCTLLHLLCSHYIGHNDRSMDTLYTQNPTRMYIDLLLNTFIFALKTF